MNYEVLGLDSFQGYVNKMQNCAYLAETDELMLQDLKDLVRSHQEVGATDENYTNFLKAEQAFYSGNYQHALKLYLLAKSIPNSAFFCYRASAYVSYEMHRTNKAIGYVKKALKICSNDYLCLKLLKNMQSQEGNSSTSIHTSLDQESTQDFSSAFGQQQLSLGEEEMEELANLFNDESEEIAPMQTQDYTEQEVSSTSTEEKYDSAMTESVESLQQEETTTDTHPSSLYFGDASGERQGAESSTEVFDEVKDTLSQLQDLATQTAADIAASTTDFITGNLGISLDSGPSLEQRVNAFQRSQAECMSQYIDEYSQRPCVNDRHLLVLNGWEYQESESTGQHNALKERLLPSSYRRTTGGYFVRWRGKGVVINPGPHFLDKFHKQGLHIKDIDYVIVTQDSPNAYTDVQAIYDLNYALNKMDTQLHIIHYYLNQQAHRHLSPRLKPHFKQERNSIHSLELFVDSPDTESLILDENITLHYFATSAQEASQVGETKASEARINACVGIRLAFRTEDNEASAVNDRANYVQLGYISGSAYSPILAHHLSGSETIIAAWEDTCANDYQKVQYNESSLGYYGSATLLEELDAQLLVCCEYSGREGDVRVEGTKKLRQDEACTKHNRTAVVPGDTGMVVDLETQQVQCSLTKSFVDASQVRVVKTQEAFGKLKYLSNSCFI